MSFSNTAVVRTQDTLLEDAVRQSPVDLEQAAVHRRVLLLSSPWLWCLAPLWVLGPITSLWSDAARLFQSDSASGVSSVTC